MDIWTLPARRLSYTIPVRKLHQPSLWLWPNGDYIIWPEVLDSHGDPLPHDYMMISDSGTSYIMPERELFYTVEF